MPAKIIDGAAISKAILAEVAERATRLQEECGRRPGLVTILVGNNPASQSYVKRKASVAHSLGFHELQENLPQDASERDVLELIESYNQDAAVDAILVQLPLPGQINEKNVIMAIDPAKDVDGFHPLNQGKLLAGEKDAIVPCTPAGIIELLLRSGIPPAGAEALVVGRSNIVGKPVAALLARNAPGGNATVTLAHSRTRDLAAHCRRADILIAAVGKPEFIKGEWIKPGAAVIDVGVNRIGLNPETGKAILRGDVEYDKAVKTAGCITPVPGGVGPMTIAMLMKNALELAEKHCNEARKREADSE